MNKQVRLIDANKVIEDVERRMNELLRDRAADYDRFPVINALENFVGRLKSDMYAPDPIPLPTLKPDEPLTETKDREKFECPHCTTDFIMQARTALPFWLQQYAELEKEHAYAKKQAIMWNDKAIAEKERANMAEAEAEKWRVEAFKQHPTQDAYDAACAALHKHRERADQAEQHNVELCKKILETESREQKLKEAIEAAINEKAQWGDAGNALDVIVRYLSYTISSLYTDDAVIDKGAEAMNYIKLTNDLRDAYNAATVAAEMIEDKGTANLDKVFLILPNRVKLK